MPLNDSMRLAKYNLRDKLMDVLKLDKPSADMLADALDSYVYKMCDEYRRERMPISSGYGAGP